MQKIGGLLTLLAWCLSWTSVRAGLPVAFSPDLRPIRMAPALYNNYVRPQLRGMLSEFYDVLKRLHPLASHFVEIKEELLKMEQDRREWEKSCPMLKAKSCLSLAHKFRVQVQSIEKKVLETLPLNSRSHAFEMSFLSYPDEALDTTLEIHALLENLSSVSFQLLTLLDQIIFQIKSNADAKPAQEKNLQFQFIKLDVLADLLLIEPTPYQGREKFRSVWANFFKRLEKNILLQENPGYLSKNLGDLNFILNEFNIYVDKKRNTVTRALAGQMESIHGRWNSILRIILGA